MTILLNLTELNEFHKNYAVAIVNIAHQPPFGCYYLINGDRDKACCMHGTGESVVYVPPTPQSSDHLLPCPYGKIGDEVLLGWSQIPAVIEFIDIKRLKDFSDEEIRMTGLSDGGCLACGNSEPCGCDDPKPCIKDAFAYKYAKIWDENPYAWLIIVAKKTGG